MVMTLVFYTVVHWLEWGSRQSLNCGVKLLLLVNPGMLVSLLTTVISVATLGFDLRGGGVDFVNGEGSFKGLTVEVKAFFSMYGHISTTIGLKMKRERSICGIKIIGPRSLGSASGYNLIRTVCRRWVYTLLCHCCSQATGDARPRSTIQQHWRVLHYRSGSSQLTLSRLAL